MTTLAILQPGYLPWLGYFDLMRRADFFILYDDVQFDKHGWRNRNRVKSPQGPLWLTVPVHHKGLNQPIIRDIHIDNQTRWAIKHQRTLEQLYTKTPFAKHHLPELFELLSRPWDRLLDLNIACAAWLANGLGVSRPLILSSDLNIANERNERLIAICQRFQADVYISGNAAQEYLDTQRFLDNGITVEWQNYQHPVYPQAHGPFVSHLSALDLLLNAGPDAPRILRGDPPLATNGLS